MPSISIILYEPEIPPNTGNIIRLCANSGAHLHLIKPLGFRWEDKALRRAGLDYHEWVTTKLWDSFDECISNIKPKNIYAMTTKGTRNFFDITFTDNDVLVFGPETRGLPNSLLDQMQTEQKCRIPMTDNGRSLNLSNTVAISIYEVWRQLEFIPLS